MGWWAPVISATWDVEAGESLKLRGWRLQWAKTVPLHCSLGDKSETPSKKKNVKNILAYRLYKNWALTSATVWPVSLRTPELKLFLSGGKLLHFCGIYCTPSGMQVSYLGIYHRILVTFPLTRSNQHNHPHTVAQCDFLWDKEMIKAAIDQVMTGLESCAHF